MDEDLQSDPLDYADPVIVKVPLKTPDDALDYWNHRLETVSSERRLKSGGIFIFSITPHVVSLKQFFPHSGSFIMLPLP